MECLKCPEFYQLMLHYYFIYARTTSAERQYPDIGADCQGATH